MYKKIILFCFSISSMLSAHSLWAQSTSGTVYLFFNGNDIQSSVPKTIQGLPPNALITNVELEGKGGGCTSRKLTVDISHNGATETLTSWLGGSRSVSWRPYKECYTATLIRTFSNFSGLPANGDYTFSKCNNCFLLMPPKGWGDDLIRLAIHYVMQNGTGVSGNQTNPAFSILPIVQLILDN